MTSLTLDVVSPATVSVPLLLPLDTVMTLILTAFTARAKLLEVWASAVTREDACRKLNGACADDTLQVGRRTTERERIMHIGDREARKTAEMS